LKNGKISETSKARINRPCSPMTYSVSDVEDMFMQQKLARTGKIGDAGI
jgi:hypothetical protein